MSGITEEEVREMLKTVKEAKTMLEFAPEIKDALDLIYSTMIEYQRKHEGKYSAYAFSLHYSAEMDRLVGSAKITDKIYEDSILSIAHRLAQAHYQYQLKLKGAGII